MMMAIAVVEEEANTTVKEGVWSRKGKVCTYCIL